MSSEHLVPAKLLVILLHETSIISRMIMSEQLDPITQITHRDVTAAGLLGPYFFDIRLKEPDASLLDDEVDPIRQIQKRSPDFGLQPQWPRLRQLYHVAPNPPSLRS